MKVQHKNLKEAESGSLCLILVGSPHGYLSRNWRAITLLSNYRPVPPKCNRLDTCNWTHDIRAPIKCAFKMVFEEEIS